MEQLDKIRNFSIISHVDHGKSTLADRMLEMTGTIEKRKMKEQVLDQMELERERGITIKMTPVRMIYKVNHAEARSTKHEARNKSEIQNSNNQSNFEFRDSSFGFSDSEFILNLIDTPGHIDFSYEVSRALKAVEGAVLLVDSTQGVQAQTLTTLDMARELGLAIIPALSKIDSPLARVGEVKEEVVKLLGCAPEDVLLTSGKTGEGVDELLGEIIKRVPPPRRRTVAEKIPRSSAPRSSVAGDGGGSSPRSSANALRALVFDFEYSEHKGIIVYIRVFDGKVSKNDQLIFQAAGEKFVTLEVGIFSPGRKSVESLWAGEVGYVVTGIKKPGVVSVGDTITHAQNPLPALSGYREPKPVVWASLYPENADDFPLLVSALERLRLTDSSLSFEEEASRVLGRGFRCGFLGMLHLEVVTERLKREFDLNLVVTTPSICYSVVLKSGKEEKIYSPYAFPDDGEIEKVLEPWVDVTVIVPNEYLSSLLQLLYEYEANVLETKNFGEQRSRLEIEMPLRELMRGFFDKLKSATSGFASLTYEIADMRKAEVTRLDILVAEEVVPAFSRIISKKRAYGEAKKAVGKLYELLPRQLFAAKIQGRALGRILSSKTLKALRKDVTAKLYGGDVTRKMKLLEKQKKGKKKMAAYGRVNIPQEVFLKMLKN